MSLKNIRNIIKCISSKSFFLLQVRIMIIILSLTW
jgi:hypothetical protein